MLRETRPADSTDTSSSPATALRGSRTNGASINSFQRRHRWVVIPFRIFNLALTPERWTTGVDRATARFTRAAAFDTTPLARRLQRIDVVSPVWHALLGYSAALRWLDWKIRKTFWACVWCGVIQTELWPRRTPIPKLEKPIQLLPAPATYRDFQAPQLVVPDDVPSAEKSLSSRIGTQVIHLLQDLYPIINEHQAEAHPDPQVRFDRAYDLLYRLTREKPYWHPDLVEASRSRNLLGALGAGGPFAKLLERVGPDSDEYVIDLRYLRNYPVRDGLCHMGARIVYTVRHRQLVISGVEYDGRLVVPGEGAWELTERIALAGLMTHLTVWRQGMEYHVGGLAPVPVLTHNYLPPAHPVRRLLAPHMLRWMTTSLHTHVTLRRRGFDVTGFAFPSDVILRYYNDGAAAFDIRRLDVELDARRRGIPDSLEYPWLPQALRYQRMFEKYVGSYVERYYGSDDEVRSDPHLALWFEALDRTLVRGVRALVPECTRDGLVRLCTVLMYSASVAHTENSLTNYGGFLPTGVRRDGKQQSVGEVQNIINFQLLIATPTTFLLDDHSHVALDGRGKQIMQRFQSDLLAFEQELQAQPSRYWRLRPGEIEASVSC
jgi:lipoxygenase